MEVKTIIKYYHTADGMVGIKYDNAYARKDMEQLKHIHTSLVGM